jgi:uncharacterized membrane protein
MLLRKRLPRAQSSGVKTQLTTVETWIWSFKIKESTSLQHWKRFAFLLSCLSSETLAAQTLTFTVQVLGNIPGADSTYVSAINNAGEAVGGSGEGNSDCPYSCAVIWHNGVPTLLETQVGYTSGATAINNAGQIAGQTFPVSTLAATAVVWNNGNATLLPSPDPEFPVTAATAINDAGVVAGFVSAKAGFPYEAVVWNGVTPTVLDSELSCTKGAMAAAINDNGTVAGQNLCPTNSAGGEATVWNGTTGTLLGPGKPRAINNSGVVVGLGLYGATVWVDGVVRHLAIRSVATAVNDLGMIVGEVPGERYSYRAALWSSASAEPQDLNKLIGAAAEKYVLTEAMGINNSCTIVANGFLVSEPFGKAAFLLKPTDPSNCKTGL